MTRDDFPNARAVPHASQRTNVDRQAAYTSARRQRGDKLVAIWMTPETFALWQRLHPQHGGTQAATERALYLLENFEPGISRL